VYAGEARLVDSEGRDRSGALPFRYISRSGDSMGRIVTFSFDGAAAGSPEVALRAAVVGTPIDFTIEDSVPDAASGTLVFEALDGNGRAVASTSGVASLHATAEDLRLALALPEGAKFLGYRLRLVAGDGTVLDTEEGTLFGQADASVFGNPLALPIAVTAIGVLLAALVLWLVARSGRASAAPPAAAATLAVALIAAASLVSAPAPVSALTCSDDSPSVWFNTPTPNKVFQCGVPIPVSVSGIYDACSNSGSNERMWVTFENKIFGETATAWDNGVIAGKHERRGLNASMTIDGPVRNGTYTIDAYMQNASGCWTKQAHATQTFQVVNCDQCNNLAGDQSQVPAGMIRDVNGDCVCPAGKTFDQADGRCEGGGHSDCKPDEKLCGGACVPADQACDEVVVDQCVFAPEGNQYCVEIYDRQGNRTDQFAAYDAADLEQMFGFGLREAVYEQKAALAVAGATYPVWGVVGRAISGAGGIDANYGSAGCAGALCAYGEEGCLTTTDPVTNSPVGNCCPVNDVTGGGKEPAALIQVDPSVVGKGGHCTVYWSSHEMESCTVTGAGVSSSALAGISATPALQESAGYTLSCTGLDGRSYTDTDSCAVSPDVIEF
jgi:hypothetical protein